VHRNLPGMESLGQATAALRPCTEHHEALRVAVRVRPFTEQDKRMEGGARTCAVSMVGQSTRVRTEEGLLQFSTDLTFWSHDPQGVGHATQEDVFNDLGVPLLRSGLSGYSGCLVAYGQSGAGKSHSIIGTTAEPGVLPRLVDGLLQERSWAVGGGTGGSSAGGFELRVWFSAIEIYSERVRDLLSPFREPEGAEEPVFIEHPALGVQVVGAIEAPCLEATDARQMLDYAFKKRAATVVNAGGATSSRSHAVFSVLVDVCHGNRNMHARLMLADLAGSERRFRMNTLRKPNRDGRAINQSLATLGLVVRELAEGGQAAARTSPFQASKLTLALKDALAGNSRTWFLACLAPGTDSAEETAATLRFAESVRRLRTCPRPQHSSLAEALSVLQEDAFRLRIQLFSSGEYDNPSREITDRQRLMTDLRMTSRHLQADEGVRLAREREKALEAAGLLVEDVEDSFSLEQVTPYLMNMSDDPMLAGRLLYFLRRGAETSIGSDPASRIVVTGLGVVPQLCVVVNHDNVRVTLQRNEACKRNVLLNGQVVASNELVQLCHHDRLFLGQAIILRLHVPMQAEVETIDESQEHTGTRPPPPINELVLSNHLREVLPRLPERSESFGQLQLYMEHSESFSELQLYMEDLYDKLDADRGHSFFKTLQEACHLVDEANMITREVRPEDRLHFEVEFVWDIYRDVEDILMIRVMCFDDRDREGRAGDAVLHYWTYAQFRERLDMMRDVYLLFHHTGCWPGRNDTLMDPWAEPNPADMQQRLLLAVLAERRRACADRPSSPTVGFSPGRGANGRVASASSECRQPSVTKLPSGGATVLAAESGTTNRLRSSPRGFPSKVGRPSHDNRSDSVGRARHLQQQKRTPQNAAGSAMGGAVCISGLVPPGGVADGRAGKATQVVLNTEYATPMDSYQLAEASGAPDVVVTAPAGLVSGSRTAPLPSIAMLQGKAAQAQPANEEADRLKELVASLQQQLAAIKEKTDSIDDMRDQMQFMQSMLSTVPSGLASCSGSAAGGSLTDRAAGSALPGESIFPAVRALNMQGEHAARLVPQGVCSSDTGVRTCSTEDVELVELTGPDSLSATPSAPQEAPCGSPPTMPVQPLLQATPTSAVPVRVMAPAPRAVTPTSTGRAESARVVRGRHELGSPRPDDSGTPISQELTPSQRSHLGRAVSHLALHPTPSDQPTGRPPVTLMQTGPQQSGGHWASARAIISPPRSPLVHHRASGVGSPVPSPLLQHRATGVDSPSRPDAGEQRSRLRSGSGSGSRSRPNPEAAAPSSVYCSTAPGTVPPTPVLRQRGTNAGSRFSSPMPSARTAVVEGAAAQSPFAAFPQASTGPPLSPMSMARMMPTGNGPVTFVSASGSTSSLHSVQAGQPTVRQAQSASQTPSATPRVTWIMPQGR